MTFAPTWAARDARLSATTRPAEWPGAGLLKEKSTKALYLSAAKLSPGKHVIAAGSSRVEVSSVPAATDAAALKGSAVFYMHQPIKEAAEAMACEKCHTMSGEAPARVLGLAKVPGACESCHEEVNIQLAHRHVLDSLRKCSSCHDPHGSTREKLLVGPPEKLCTQCHEGGHSKK